MSVGLDQIVFDIAQGTGSSFTSIVYDSLCEQVKPFNMGSCELPFFGDIDLSSDLALFSLLLTSFLGNRKAFPESFVPVVVPQDKNPLPSIVSPQTSLVRDSAHGLLVPPVKENGETGKFVRVAYKKFPEEKFKEIVLDSVESYCKQRSEELTVGGDRVMGQVNLSFKLALVFLITGASVIFAGIVSQLVFGYVLHEMLINVGIFSEVAGFFVLCINLYAKKRLGKYISELNRLEKLRTAKFYVDQVKDMEKRNVALKALLESVLL